LDLATLNLSNQTIVSATLEAVRFRSSCPPTQSSTALLLSFTTYDESIDVLRRSLDAAKVGDRDKLDGMARLDRYVRAVEARYAPAADFGATLAHEQAISASLGGRAVFDGRRRARSAAIRQLGLFER
jgi:hypothetical protein